MWTKGIGHFKIYKDPTRNEACDLQSCGTVPKPTVVLLAPSL